MEDIINSISQYGYIIIALYSFGGGFFAIVGGAILASMGKLDIFLVIAIAGTSNMVGDLFLFYFGKYNKKDVLEYPFFIKHRRKVAYSKLMIKKYEIFTIFIQKYIYGVKTIIPILLGIVNYNFSKFAILNIVASFVWAVVMGFGGFYFANIIQDVITEYQINPLILPIILLIIIFIFWKWIDYKLQR